MFTSFKNRMCRDFISQGNKSMNRSYAVGLISIVVCWGAAQAQARIGDTKESAESRFKASDTIYAKDKYGFEYASYSTGGFSIKQYYREGVCVKSIYYKKKVEGSTLKFLMPEIQKIAEIEAAGAWEVTLPPGSGNGALYAAFKNAKGTTLEILNTKRMVTVETKAYRDVVESH